MRRFDALSNRMAKGIYPLSHVLHIVSEIDELKALEVDSVEKLMTLGFPITKTNEDNVTLQTRLKNLEDFTFCIVDIETTNSDVAQGEIIEIGAVKMKNFEIVDKFNTLVYAEEVPEPIVKLTGIDAEKLKDAPALSEVLEKFRVFLGDSLFVAHNVNFDYNFISETMLKCGFGPLLNRKLCTIELAKKTIPAERYGLEHLREQLGLNEGELHRGYSDAFNAMEILKVSLKNLPDDICTIEDLIGFAHPNQKKRKKKKEKQKRDRRDRNKKRSRRKSA